MREGNKEGFWGAGNRGWVVVTQISILELFDTSSIYVLCAIWH